MSPIPPATLSLADAERRASISREVMRKWALRYGFPQALRDARGRRCFDAATVDKMALLARLVARGERISSLVGLDTAALRQRLAPGVCTDRPDAHRVQADVADLMVALTDTASPHRLGTHLKAVLHRAGLADFVTHWLPAFSDAVGLAWQTGQLRVDGEHRYTALVTETLVRALPPTPTQPRAPCVLLATPPGELHGLGLLALQALLSLEHAHVINLGVQMPVAELAQAARGWSAAVVGLSLSVRWRPKAAQAHAQTLRQALPPHCELWLGGAGAASVNPSALAPCQVFSSVAAAAQRWRVLAAAASAPSVPPPGACRA